MQNFIIVAVMNFFALLLVSNIMHGIVIHGWQTFIAASIVLSFINLFLKPILKVIFLPINILSLGFFTLIINAVILYCTSGIVKGFYVIKRNVKVLRNNNEEREERNRINSAQVIDVEEIKDDKKD